MMAPVVVWFRRDLRIHDNPALAEGAASGRPVVPLFVLDEESPGVRPLGGASRWWLHESLRSLAEDLAGLGLSLCLRRAPAADVLHEVVREMGAGRVVWNRCHEPASIACDSNVETALRAAGVETESYGGSLLIEPGEILTRQGAPYKVFTPFWRRVRESYRAPLPHPAPKRPAPGPAIASDRLEDWRLQPTAPDWAGGLRETWEAGEAAARRRLAASRRRRERGRSSAPLARRSRWTRATSPRPSDSSASTVSGWAGLPICSTSPPNRARRRGRRSRSWSPNSRRRVRSRADPAGLRRRKSGSAIT